MKTHAIAAAAGLALGALAGWFVTDLAGDAQIATLQGNHAEQLRTITAERDEQSRRALAAQQDAADAVARLDQQHYEEIARARTENEQLRAAVAAGARRLSIVATCPAAGGVPAPAGAAGLDHAAGRADIDPGAAARIVALTDRGDEAIRMLRACQDYARTVSR